MLTSTYFLRTYWLLATATALLAGPAYAAADSKPEITIDPAAGVVADRLPYATPFSLAAMLPDGADAKLSYWPRGPKTSRTKARQETKEVEQASCKAARAANAGYLIERQGVASGAAEKGQRKYVFAVDPLRVNVSYCFSVEYTTYTGLSAGLRGRVASGIGRALDGLLKILTTPITTPRTTALYPSTCNAEELSAVQALKAGTSMTGRIPGCMLVDELAQQEPELSALKVRREGESDIEPFLAVFARRLEEDDALQELLGDTLRAQQLRTNLLRGYDSLLKKVRATVSTPPPADQAALATALQALPAVPDGTCDKAIDDARTAAKCEPGVVPNLCAYLTTLKTICREIAAQKAPIDTLKETDLFKALIDDMKEVTRVQKPSRPLPLGKPTFEEWIPFHASLDVGAAAIAFRSNTWGIAQYLGVNFYFTAVDRDERLVWGHRGYKAFGGRELLKRLSLTLGVTTTGATLRNEDGVTGALGNQFLLYGAGFRLLGGLRLSAGGVLYKQSSQNPARAGVASLKTSPFISLSFDIDLFRWIRRGAGYEK